MLYRCNASFVKGIIAPFVLREDEGQSGEEIGSVGICPRRRCDYIAVTVGAVTVGHGNGVPLEIQEFRAVGVAFERNRGGPPGRYIFASPLMTW